MAITSDGKVNASKGLHNHLKTGSENYNTFHSRAHERPCDTDIHDEDNSSNNEYSFRWKQIVIGVFLFILCISLSKVQDKSFGAGSSEGSRSVNTRNPDFQSLENGKSFTPKDTGEIASNLDDDTQTQCELPRPFSTLSPYDKTTNENAKIPPFLRSKYTQPGAAFGPVLSQGAHISGRPVPTSIWYQNLLLGDNLDIRPTQYQQVHVLPYVLDFIGPIPGMRVHFPYPTGGDTVVQYTYNPLHSLTLGKDLSRYRGDDFAYHLLDHNGEEDDNSFSNLGFHLEWRQPNKEDSMTAPVVRGMPYATVIYGGDTLPVVASDIHITDPPLIDGHTRLSCDGQNVTAKVTRDVELYFKDSDFTWLVFYSRPVTVYCTDDDGAGFKLGVMPDESNDQSLVVRIALANTCTIGRNSLFCFRGKPRNADAYKTVLREHSDVYPRNPALKYTIPKESNIQEEPRSVTLEFDWGVQDFNNNGNKNNKGALLFALPHHKDLFVKSHDHKEYDMCVQTYHGTACPVSSNKWIMHEDLPHLGHTAPRPPNAKFIPALSNSLHSDVDFKIPDYFMRGAGDTYFSGKQLAKLGRIVVILDELKKLQRANSVDDVKHLYSDVDMDALEESILASQNVSLPTDDKFEATLDRLRRGVEVWVNGTAETAFVYDLAWGGLVSCGCWFNGKNQNCDNAYPDCPAFSDQGLNFGNGFYNDHHFHYGYHIHAAAVVAKFDPQWGRENFDDVLLLVRDIANPSIEDTYFPAFRQKDWYLGTSWASGIPTLGGHPYSNGRNQESSSEAIAAYEAVALFGSSMVDAWKADENNPASKENALTAAHIRDIGRLLTSTEVRAADTYYHVRHDAKSRKVYPSTYAPWVVGMMWSMMAQFQTWFGNAAFLAYGIQLLPLTPVSELRDNVTWAKELYNDLAKSCEGNTICFDQGWAVLQYAVLAEVGHAELAVEKTLAMPDSVFDSAGGNGHSRSNSLWYVSSRADTNPIPLKEEAPILDCGRPQTCTRTVLHTKAEGITCIDRIKWLIEIMGQSDSDACAQVGGVEHPDSCGGCGPEIVPEPSAQVSTNHPVMSPVTLPISACGCATTCTNEILNVVADGSTCGARIDFLVWSDGMEKSAACAQIGGMEFPTECGGCDPARCVNVANLPTSPKEKPNLDDGECGPCPDEVCNSDLNRCPVSGAPYLCYSGANLGGCSPVPWALGGSDCSKCCKISQHCLDWLLV